MRGAGGDGEQRAGEETSCAREREREKEGEGGEMLQQRSHYCLQRLMPAQQAGGEEKNMYFKPNTELHSIV